MLLVAVAVRVLSLWRAAGSGISNEDLTSCGWVLPDSIQVAVALRHVGPRWHITL